jgi:hypothetical protein
MAQIDMVEEHNISAGTRFVAWLGRVFLAVIIPLLAFAVIYYGFLFLRDSNAPKWVITIVAIVWGVGGVALLSWVFNGLVERLPDEWTRRLGLAGLSLILAQPVRPGRISRRFLRFFPLDLARSHPE